MDFDAKWQNDAVPDETIKTPHQGICPDGWHIPTQSEWDTLSYKIRNLYGNHDDDGIAAVQSTGHLSWPNATNESGFSVLPVGYNYEYNYNEHNLYDLVGKEAWFWSVSEGVLRYDYSFGWKVDERFSYTYYSSNKYYGYSVRCVQDDPVKP